MRWLLLELGSYGGTDALGMFPLFLARTADVLPFVSLWYFGGSFVWVAFLFAGECLMSPPIPKVPPSSKVTNYRLTPILSKVFNIGCRFVLGFLWNAEVCFQPPSSLIGMILALIMPLCVWQTPNRVLWRWGRKQEWFISTSVLRLTGSTIKIFSSSSVLWELEVQCCLFWRVSL